MVRSYLDNNMGIKLAKEDDIMKSLWFDSSNNFVQDPESSSKSFIPCHVSTCLNKFKLAGRNDWKRANVWSLIQDNEYVLTKLYSNLEVFPTLYGTCGGLYVVEPLEPLSFPSIIYKLR